MNRTSEVPTPHSSQPSVWWWEKEWTIKKEKMNKAMLHSDICYKGKKQGDETESEKPVLAGRSGNVSDITWELTPT